MLCLCLLLFLLLRATEILYIEKLLLIFIGCVVEVLYKVNIFIICMLCSVTNLPFPKVLIVSIYTCILKVALKICKGLELA